MTKRSIQTSSPGYFVGIEFDHRAIRAARVSSDGRGGFTVAALEDQAGDFSEDGALIDGLRKVKSRLGPGVRDIVVSCLAGKQVFASQMDFRRLTGEEMEQALRLELRKIVHFEVATSTLDFEILDGDGDSTGGQCQVMVALASNSLLGRHIQILEKSGLRPSAMDVLPLAVADALWIWREEKGMEAPVAALHIGHQASTIVIDGEYSPFFNRSIPISVDGSAADAHGDPERAKRLHSLADEISRSLNFHEKSTGVGGFREIVLLGDLPDDPGFSDTIKRRTGLDTVRMDLASKISGGRKPAPAGRFDLAIALALRGDA